MAMANAVAQAIERRDSLVVEAGTGVGKTYAYLVPALLSGRRVLVSTATKALQDQLFSRDLPAVTQALGLPVRTSLLKGRSSYLCLHRMEQAWQRLPAGDRYLAHQLRRIETWATSTRSGDLSEMSGLDDRSALPPLVTSTRDNCLGAQCPQFRACHVNAARREALAADLVVINHHLFFADRMVRESGMAELLPSVDLVVFDEAHQLNETGVQFLAVSLSSAELLDWVRDVLAQGLRVAGGLRDWHGLASALEKSVQDMRLCLQPRGRADAAGRRLRWHDEVPQSVDPGWWQTCTQAFKVGLEGACQALDDLHEMSPDFQRLLERGARLLERMEQIFSPLQPDGARWVELGGQFRLVLAPLDAARAFGELITSETRPEAHRTWLFTSATLGTDDALSWFTQPLGLTGLPTLRVQSPFDYPQQASVYVPRELPLPSEAAHTPAVARGAWGWAGRLGGRTLVLTTTLRALREIGREMKALRQQPYEPEILVQGEGTKQELLQRFRRAGQAGGAGAVLVASVSFWEGVDLPGDCLQLVVIDKLPFPPPDDPWVEARSRGLQAQGLSPFNAYSLPEAGVLLKQGAGRLIRSETDRGVLVICDRRLRDKGYGRALLDALPPMSRLDGEDQMTARLDELVTTASTTDLPWT